MLCNFVQQQLAVSVPPQVWSLLEECADTNQLNYPTNNAKFLVNSQPVNNGTSNVYVTFEINVNL